MTFLGCILNGERIGWQMPSQERRNLTLSQHSHPYPTLWHSNDDSKELLAKWERGELDPIYYNLRNGILSYKGRLVVGLDT